MKIKLLSNAGNERWLDLPPDLIGQPIEVPVLEGEIASRIFEFKAKERDFVLYCEVRTIPFSEAEIRHRSKRTKQELEICDNSIDV